jgi:hypothetical protein
MRQRSARYAPGAKPPRTAETTTASVYRRSSQRLPAPRERVGESTSFIPFSRTYRVLPKESACLVPASPRAVSPKSQGSGQRSPLHRRFRCPRNSRPPCLSFSSPLLVAKASGGMVAAQAGLGFRLARAPPARMSIARLFYLVQTEKTSWKGEKTMNSAIRYHLPPDDSISLLWIHDREPCFHK